MLKTVTMTGADDSVSPADLILISQRFPFVEWGILVSRNNYGTPRWPSKSWIIRLIATAASSPVPIKLSLHLCGSYVRELLIGNDSFIADLQGAWRAFQRVQINTHGIFHPFTTQGAATIAKHTNKTFILQLDNVNTHILTGCQLAGVKNIAGLFDLSHGAGISPDAWPNQIAEIKCGYAGGLGPDNLESEIRRIMDAASMHDHPREKMPFNDIWIDMETKIRSLDCENSPLGSSALEAKPARGDIFDLKKVRACLEISAPYVKQQPVAAHG